MRLQVFLLLCIPLLSFSQTSSVKLTVKEKYDHLNRNAWKDAWIYNVDTSFKQYCSIYKRKAHFDSLPPDNYTVTILSKYGNKEHQRNIHIQNGQNTSLVFNKKSNPFVHYKDSIPLIKKLTDSSLYSITWEMNGCFNWQSGWADIHKQNNKYLIRVKYNDSIYEKELPLDRIEYLYEREIDALKEPTMIHCTNRYSYTIQLDRRVYTFHRGCFDLVERLLTID